MFAPRRTLRSAVFLFGALGVSACSAQDVRVATPMRTQTSIATSRLQELGREATEPQPEEPNDEPAGSALPIEGTDFVRGSATVIVRAPIHKVREVVLSFADYPAFMPHYRACKVLGRTSSGARDVYMEIGALHGALKMWARVEIPKPAQVDGAETVMMKFIEGNVKDIRGGWRYKRLDDERTELTLEIFMRPGLPVPASVLNDENVRGAVKGVVAMRKRIEASATPR